MVNTNIRAKYEQRQPDPVYDQMQCVARFLHLGAGVQSSTLVYMMLQGDLPKVDAVLFADTGDEPDYVYDQVDYLQGLLKDSDVPLHVVRHNEQGIVQDTMYGNGRFASLPLFTRNPKTGRVGMMRRQCTNEWKIIPLKSWILDWLIEQGHATLDRAGRRRVLPGVYVENWYGISLDEFDRAGRGRGPRWQQATYPLLEMDMRREDCLAYATLHNYRLPGKSSCRVCPFHDNAYWREMKQRRPDDFEHACRFDDYLRTPEARERFNKKFDQDMYLHRSCLPLRDINFEELTDPQEVGAVCGEHCFV